MKEVLLHSGNGNGREDKKSRVLQLTPIVPAVMEDVEMEKFVAGNISGSGVRLSSATRNAYQQLQNVMREWCMVYDILF